VFFTNNLLVLLAVLVFFPPVVVSVLYQQTTAQIGIFLGTSTSNDRYDVPCFGRLLVKNTNKGGDFLTHIDKQRPV
jgi:hypothetical protein